MEPPLWTEVEPSGFDHEREALAYLKAALPNSYPWRAWTNFEFIAPDNSVNEVDALIVGPKGVFLVEIKSHPGIMLGDHLAWTWVRDDRRIPVDNPLPLANKKAKRLAGMLRSLPQLRSRKQDLYVEPLVFLSAADLDCRLQGPGRAYVVGRDELSDPARPRATAFEPLPGVLATLKDPTEARLRPHPVDHDLSDKIDEAMRRLGIRPNTRARRLGDYALGKVIADGEGWQDFAAEHTSTRTTRRIRVYLESQASSAGDRKALRHLAEREFRMLDGLGHEGIDRPLDLQTHEHGPALLFERFATDRRLDEWLATDGKPLDVLDRLTLLRQLAEALDYAHGHQVTHRALDPTDVIVRTSGDRVRLVITNWQAATRSLATRLTRTPDTTFELAAHLAPAELVYLAPEVASIESPDGVALDVFSLGSIAYFLLTGQRPADTVQERDLRLQEHGHLDLRVALEGAPEPLVDLVAFATSGIATDRPASASEFTELLDDALEKLAAGETRAHVDPLDAQAGDDLPEGRKVVRRLGKGSTALALLVEGSDGRREVLKVALSEDHADRLRAEHDVLAKIKHYGVVSCLGIDNVSGRTALRLDFAGELTATDPGATITLADRLRADGRLTVDLLRRLGDDLIEVVAYLENEGIAHRDIKPENLGVRMRGRKNELHLVLFDFSLSRTAPEHINAGTPGYLDPFLAERTPRRWDLAAERYSVAVTLYEMAVGVRPTWGDGQSDPTMLPDTLPRLDTEAFDPAVRTALAAFFGKGLARDPKVRFDTAEEMRRAWHNVFTGAAVTVTESSTIDTLLPEDELERLASLATERTPIAELGFTAGAIGALERLGIATAGALADLTWPDIMRMRGVGQRAKREIRRAAERLDVQLEHSAIEDAHAQSIDSIIRLCVPAPTTAHAATDAEPTRALLGIGDQATAEPWPSHNTFGRQFHFDREATDHFLERLRNRLLRRTSITEVRNEIDAYLAANGDLATGDELATMLVDRRGSITTGAERLRRGRSVVRAALEAEAGRDAGRFTLRRFGTRTLLVTRTASPIDAEELADYADALGERADQLASSEPLLAPDVVVQELRRVDAPLEMTPLADARLVRLAASASTTAAMSARYELYPRGLAADRAVSLTRASLLGVGRLAPEQVHERVAYRFPEAEPLPNRPELDELLRATIGLEWRDTPAPAGYEVPRPPAAPATTRYSYRTAGGSTGVPASNDDDQPVFDKLSNRLALGAERGGYLAVVVEPSSLVEAERRLSTPYGFDLVDAEQCFVNALRNVASSRRADWSRAVLAADREGPSGANWPKLVALARLAADQFEVDLRQRSKVVLTRTGVLDRYDQLGRVLDRLRHLTTSPANGTDALRSLWVLVPMDDLSAAPMIGTTAVPVFTANQTIAVPELWLRAARQGADR